MISIRFLPMRRVCWWTTRLWEFLMPFVPPQSPRKSLAARIFLGVLFLAVTALCPAKAKPQSTDDPVTSVPVFVSDFELFSVAPPPNSPGTPATTPNQQKPKAPPASEDVELLSVQARRLVDFFAATLVETLQKSGYNAQRMRGQNPTKGALLRGVFAEPDAKNRIRRALMGGSSANPRFFLYVGTFNLARPDQPLYQLASEQPTGGKYGPVITLNNYVPLAKYELDKNPSEEDVRKICAQIAASLTALLAANLNAFSE
jgi:hypothetical protein